MVRAMDINDLFTSQNAVGSVELARALGHNESYVRGWAEKLGVAKIGAAFAWTRPDVEKLCAALTIERLDCGAAPQRADLPRIGFSMAEAARMIGKRPDALRREIERVVVAEGDELVARLVAGIVARRRKNGGKWFVIVPSGLRA